MINNQQLIGIVECFLEVMLSLSMVLWSFLLYFIQEITEP